MKIAFILLSTFIVSNVYADSIGILDCGNDKDTFIEISRLPESKTLDALLTQNKSDDESVTTQYEVKRSARSTVYSGDNFKLTLNAEKTAGHLEAVNSEGKSVEADLGCTVY